MHVTTSQYPISSKNHLSQLKLNPPEHNLPATEKTHWKKAAFWHKIKVVCCLLYWPPFYMWNWLHSNGSKWQITILLTDDRQLQDRKVEYRSQMFVYRLSPFSFPHIAIFSPFPQTESLFTGYFYVSILHQSCGGWTLFFYPNTFFCYNKFTWLLATWVHVLYTLIFGYSPFVHLP